MAKAKQKRGSVLVTGKSMVVAGEAVGPPIESSFLPEPIKPEPGVRIPPLPVFDEHIGNFLKSTEGFTCTSKEDLERGKAIRNIGAKLKSDMAIAFAEPKRFIDSLKQPFLDKEREDTAKVTNGLNLLDSQAKAFLEAERKKAEEEAERRRQEEIRQRQAQQDADAQALKDWGDDRAAEEVAKTPIVEPRPVKVDLGLSYARGVRVNKKWVPKIVNPDSVKMAYCSPDLQKIKAKVANYFNLVKEPTDEQKKTLIEEIGGIELVLE